MTKIKTLAMWMAAVCVAAAQAQSPADGRVVNGAYVNNYFHLTYTWPATLKPVELPTAAAERNDPKAYEFPLFSAKQGTQPYGMILVAQKLNVAGPHAAGVKSSGDMIDRLAKSLRPGPILSNINRTQKKSARGVVFDELDYQQNGKPSVVMATQAGPWILVFKGSAGSPADIDKFEKSVLATRVGK